MAATRKIPLRVCIGCGQEKDKREMLRVIRDSDNQISLDVTGKKNGRGAYVCKNGECLKKAISTKGLEKSLKTQIPDEVYTKLKEEMKAYEQ